MNQKISMLSTEETSFFRNVNLFFSFLFLAFGLCWTTTAYAYPGDLDRTFGQNGTAQIAIGRYEHIRAAALQPDGKIIAVGFSREAPDLKVLIIRLNPDGSLDTGFGNSGIVSTTLNGAWVNANTVHFQTDGKIIVSGFAGFNADSEFAVVRFNKDGSLDSGFGTNGVVITHIGDSYDNANAISLQSDGKIIVAGTTNITLFTSNYAIVRYNPDGSLDTTFGNGGIVKTSIGNFDGANAVIVQADGKIVAAGYGRTGVPNPDFAIVRYNSNGALDTTFDEDGIATTQFGNESDERINDVALQPDGKILALGTALNDNGTFVAALARFNSNGSLDSGFGEGGKLTFNYGVGSAAAFTVALQSDGKIIGGGHSSTQSSSYSTVFRLHGNGNFDRSFGNAGIVFNSPFNSLVGLLVQNDSKIIGVNSGGIKRFVTGGVAYFDFDADRKDDISIFRPSLGEWWYQKSSNGGDGAFQFGSSSDKMTPADFTGDGKSDFAFFRPETGEWFVLRSEDSSFYSFPFGTNGDVPTPADYDADGKADAAVFRPSTNTWYISKSTGGTTIQTFGSAEDVPVVADYDGDGRADIAIYRSSKGEWWIQRSSAGSIAFQFGSSTDKPVQGDYTGDGKADVAFFRPSTGEWYVLRSENQSFYSFPFGTSGDVPSPGDYDGDGKTDAAVFRPSNNTWFIQRTTSGTLIQTFGQTGDKPVPSAFVP